MKSLLLFIAVIFTLNFAFAQPTTNFSASPLEICVGENIQFTDLSTSTGTITGWTWDFGDGGTSSQQNPSHTYTNAGNFTVILTAVNANGASPEVKINYITVNPIQVPTFDPVIIGGCSLPSEVSINNIQPSTGVSYSWDFGNGTTSNSGSPANVIYNNENSYNITLTVTNNTTGCVSSLTETIDIYDYDTDFSITSSPFCAGSPIDFLDNSSPGTDTWSWDFGDGSSSSVQNPSHTYNSNGTYTVTLTASNSVNGCSDTYSQTIEILQIPNPSFTFTPNSGCAPLDVTFTNTSSGSGNFQWNYGDGNTYSGTTPPVYSYTNNGSFSVTLTQTDANGCSNSVTQNNIINVSSITAQFNADVKEGCEILDVNFTDLSTSPNASDPITSWVWDFGNGSTFNGENPPTQNFSEGVYDVSLTISTNAGCSQTLTNSDYISVGIQPNADFTWTPPQGCAKSMFNFTNSTTVSVPSTPSDFSYSWSFGDGGVSSNSDPTYNYPADTGYFDVQLISKFRGCPDTITYQNAVYITAPIAKLNFNSVHCNPTLPLDVNFTDNAILGADTDNVKMTLDWGDGTSESYTSPNLFLNNPGQINHTYNNLGSYSVKQVVHNYTTGCSDSVVNILHLSEIEALYTFTNDSICVNDQISISANPSNSTHTISSSNYSFNINNETVINSSNFNYAFDTPGTKDITLYVSNVLGCQDSIKLLDLEVLGLPIANIATNDTTGCIPLTANFANNSTSQSGIPLSNFNWTFEDGSTQTTNSLGQSTNYTFNSEGVFETSLLVIDEFGCSSITNVQTEITQPVALFDAPSVVCNNEVFTGVNNSQNYSTSEWFVNNTPETNDNNLTTSFNHLGSPTTLSYTDSIMLVVTDLNGCKDTMSQNINVSTPNADFDFIFSGANINDDGNYVCPPVFTDLTDLSASFGTITDWNWDFSDGKVSILQNPNNTYVFAGTYSGTLIITDEFGCSDTMVYADYLTIGGPIGDVEWTINNQCEQEYTFTPSELEGVTDIIWNMGNGDTINSLDEFNYVYTSAGSYYPSATLINDDNCNITYLLDTIEVEVNPLNTYFEVNPMSMNWGEPATITDYSSGGFGGIVNWSWEIEGNQFNNNGDAFDYLFNTAGAVTITLVVTDSAGCTDSYQVIVNISTNLTIPNILTPNGDGVNDVFKLVDNSYKSYKVTILNRWGNVVNESYIIEGNYLWDGLKKNGDECVDGVYFYIIDGTERDGSQRTEHGFVTLVR